MGEEPAPRTVSDHAEVERLHLELARTGSPDARRRLALHHLPLARSLARRMHRGNEPLEDLVQVASESLLHALDRYDPDRGIPFDAFARPTIIGALKRHYRDLGWALRVPRTVHDLTPSVRAARERLTQQLGRAPTASEVAADLGREEDVIRMVSTAHDRRELVPLDAPTGGRDEDRGDGYEVVGRADPGFARTENHLDLRDALAVLPDDDRELLRRYYVEEDTQSCIAESQGVSQMQISRRLGRITRRLRSEMSPV